MPNPTTEAVFDALCHERRRNLLFRLLRHPATTVNLDTDDCAAEWYHQHLPALEKTGLVNYEETGARIDVRRGAEWEEYEPLLQAARDVCQQATM